MATAVIAGAGVAGATAVLRLRSGGYDGRVVLIGDEPCEPYRRPPLSKDLLSGKTPEERTKLRPPETWAKQEIELRTGAAAVSLDVAARKVELADGEWLSYDQLLLATGGRPRELPQASGVPGVYTLRALADVPALRSALGDGARLLVIGAGLIGAEVAATARGLGCAVTMLEAEPQPLSRLLPPEVSEAYAGLHREHGVELHTDVMVETFAHDGDGVHVADSTGRSWTADAVVVAVGMVPCTELAERAGLEVANGVVVDEHFATSAPGVFAAGDVANQPNVLLGGRQRIEHWTSAQEHGTAAADSMLGDRTPFAKVPWCWSDQYGVNLQVTGWPAASDDITLRGDPGELNFTALFHRDARLVGAVAVKRPKEIRLLRKLIAEQPHATPADLDALLS